MRNFSNGQRIKVNLPHDRMHGKVGTVVRLRMGDNGAWVKMDDELPEELRSFPVGDSRDHHLLLYPEDCEKA